IRPGGRPPARAGAEGRGRARSFPRPRARTDRAGAARGRSGAHRSRARRLRGARSCEVLAMALVVVPTPIGNLEDVTLRGLRALREADLVLCEDTRRTRTLLQRYGVDAKLLSYHAHNEAKRVAAL